MVDWTTPKDLKTLQVFLGLTGYYRSFWRSTTASHGDM